MTKYTEEECQRIQEAWREIVARDEAQLAVLNAMDQERWTPEADIWAKSLIAPNKWPELFLYYGRCPYWEQAPRKHGLSYRLTDDGAKMRDRLAETCRERREEEAEQKARDRQHEALMAAIERRDEKVAQFLKEHAQATTLQDRYDALREAFNALTEPLDIQEPKSAEVFNLDVFRNMLRRGPQE